MISLRIGSVRNKVRATAISLLLFGLSWAVPANAQDVTQREPDILARQLLSTFTSELDFHPADTLSVSVGKMSGANWSTPWSTSVFTGGHSVYGTSPEQWMAWKGVTAVDLSFTRGTWQAGVAVSNQCIPSCGSVSLVLPGTPAGGAPAVYRAGVAGDPNSNTQTVAPHLSGQWGNFQFRVMAPRTNGTVVTIPTGPQPISYVAASGEGYQAGGRWELAPAYFVSVDVQQFTDESALDAGHALTRLGFGLKTRFDRTELAIHSVEVDTGVPDQRFMLIEYGTRYRIPVGKGAIIPELVRLTYTHRTDSPFMGSASTDLTETQVRMNAQLPF